MSNVILKSIKNFKYVFFSQILVLIFGIINALVIPVILSVRDFGYWQIYMFYSSYVGIFALGFNDGIYLRYGSYEYTELPYKRLRTTIRLHIIILIIFSALVYFYSWFIEDTNKQFVLWIVCLNIIVLGINGVFIYVLQITNKMKQYSFFSILPKLILMLALILYLLFKINRFEYFIIIDLIAKIIVVAGMILSCKELWFGKNCNIKVAVDEYRENVTVGVQLMLAQFMGMLVLGISRFIVEWLGNIEDFAYYSFGVTVTNLILVLITSISLLAYPTLKRLEVSSYPRYFEKINSFLRVLNLFIPFFYFMAALFILLIMPKYESVLIYLNLLFAVIMFQAKMQLLNNTFYKALRKETAMMKSNLSSVLFFLILVTILYAINKNIWSIALCTLITMAWRCFSSEIYLRKVMNQPLSYKGIMSEMLYIVVFVMATNILSLVISSTIYGLFLLVFLFKHRNNIIDFIKKLNFITKVESNG